jgi:hypothetical protein
MNAITDAIAAMPPSEPVFNPPGASPKSNLRALVARATGVLLVIPALINAGYDVYAAALKLPRTDAEKVNTEMFRKYFNKAPLATLPVPVKSSIGTVDARFAIYEEGEIYVEFGKLSQWFPFPHTDHPKRVEFSLFPSAFAQGFARVDLPGQGAIASQREAIRGGVLDRSRIYVDGTTEQRKIDLRSGSTLSVDFGRIAGESVPSQVASPKILKIEPIDLGNLRMQQQLK